MNKHQIFSFRLSLSRYMKPFLSSFTSNSSFNRLQSIVVEDIDSKIIIPFLMSLACLPRLFSFTIYRQNDFGELNNIYQSIFALPMLKYSKVSTYEDATSMILPMIANEQFSPLEHLVIDHSCTLNALACMMSYVPQLRRLYFTDSGYKYSNDLPFILSNLTHLTLKIYEMKFVKLEKLIKNMNSKLTFLHVDIMSEDKNYLNSARWEKFILKYLSKLDKFFFDFTEDLERSTKLKTYLKEPNRFSSLFWIERKWILETKVDFEWIVYSIRPHKYIKNNYLYYYILVLEKVGMNTLSIQLIILLFNFQNLLDLIFLIFLLLIFLDH